MSNYIYKTRVSLFNLDLFLIFVLCVFSWFINFWICLATFILFVFWLVNIISMRIYVYENRIEYKAGFILKTYTKSMPINHAVTVTYSSGLLGKIFNYGDVIIGTYNNLDGFRLNGVKNVKMLCENINVLINKNI